MAAPQGIKAAGGIWADQEVVVDGNLVTSRYPMDLPALTREMMKMVGDGHYSEHALGKENAEHWNRMI